MYQRSVLLTVTGLALALAGAHPAAAAQVPDQNAPGQVLGRGSFVAQAGIIGAPIQFNFTVRRQQEYGPISGHFEWYNLATGESVIGDNLFIDFAPLMEVPSAIPLGTYPTKPDHDTGPYNYAGFDGVGYYTGPSQSVPIPMQFHVSARDNEENNDYDWVNIELSLPTGTPGYAGFITNTDHAIFVRPFVW